MEDLNTSGQASTPRTNRSNRLSYKFQRLRERIRQAIESGELSGKLPGERQLSRRFRVNAKTLSKALTDLAAEGVLERSIGRGTFVKGAGLGTAPAAERWLIVCDEEHVNSPLVRHIIASNPGCQISTTPAALRPSFINQFKAVIDECSDMPAALVRDLVVRNITVVRVGREPAPFSTHAVLMDRQLAANSITRDVVLGGHTRLFVVEDHRRLLGHAVRAAAQRFGDAVTVECGVVADVSNAINDGATAIICDSPQSAQAVRQMLDQRGELIPQRVSLIATGVVDGNPPCSGYFVDAEEKAATVVQLLRDKQAHRPATLWLSGAFRDLRTTASVSASCNHAFQGKVDTVSA